jgi:hypothetical protein
VNQSNVGVALGSQRQRLPGADRDRLDAVAAPPFKKRDQYIEQPGVLRACGGRQDDGAARRFRAVDRRAIQQSGERND